MDVKDKPSKDIIAAQMQVVAEVVAPWRSQVLFSARIAGDLRGRHVGSYGVEKIEK